MTPEQALEKLAADLEDRYALETGELGRGAMLAILTALANSARGEGRVIGIEECAKLCRTCAGSGVVKEPVKCGEHQCRAVRTHLRGAKAALPVDG